MTRFHFLPFILLAPLSALGQTAPSTPPPIALWNNHAPNGDGTFEAADATITVHLAPHPNGAACLICPGGAYAAVTVGPEGHRIAAWLNQHGIAGIVLAYRLPHGRSMVPLLDAQCALRLVRSRVAEWKLDPQRLGTVGFSAGGHLASTLGTHFETANLRALVSARPDFMILVYPVISMGEHTHAYSREQLLGPNPTPEQIKTFSNELQVTRTTPPTFLAHAQDDEAVPPVNSQLFYDALLAHGVATEYLKLPSGGHGLDNFQGPMWDAWQAKSLAWLAAQKIIPAADAALLANP